MTSTVRHHLCPFAKNLDGSVLYPPNGEVRFFVIAYRSPIPQGLLEAISHIHGTGRRTHGGFFAELYGFDGNSFTHGQSSSASLVDVLQLDALGVRKYRLL
jgi:hypothetical protein